MLPKNFLVLLFAWIAKELRFIPKYECRGWPAGTLATVLLLPWTKFAGELQDPKDKLEKTTKTGRAIFGQFCSCYCIL